MEYSGGVKYSGGVVKYSGGVMKYSGGVKWSIPVG